MQFLAAPVTIGLIMSIMRYLTDIVFFLVLSASVPLAAQRGVGHGFGGGRSGFAGHSGFSGHASGGHAFSGHAFSGMHAGSGFAARSFARGRSFNARPSVRGLNSRNFNRSRNLRIRTFGFRNNCFGFHCGQGFGYPWLGGAFDPYWWWDSDSYDQDQQNQIGLANQVNAQSLDEQRAREQGDQDVYARSAPPSPHQAERTEAAVPTVLVFRDQRKQEVQNYAIVGQTLWNFAPQHTEKIPISDLDLPATSKANDERGVDFRLPSGSEGQ